jgi:FkbM family methyltransferase
VTWLREGLAWRWARWRRYRFLLLTFRNGPTLLRGFMKKIPCDRAECWDGTVLHHPVERAGLPETILEIWHDRAYTASFYEPSDGDVIIDAGANVGLFSIWMARRNPGCRILAFEPCSENYSFLRRNIEAARIRSIEAYQAGLAGVAGVGRVLDGGVRSLDHRVQRSEAATDPADRIELLCLREIVEMVGNEAIDLFKIDIEGGEYDLFKEARIEELRRVKRFSIEYHDNIMEGTSALIRSRLASTHEVCIRPDGSHGYGMIFAKLKGLA